MKFQQHEPSSLPAFFRVWNSDFVVWHLTIAFIVALTSIYLCLVPNQITDSRRRKLPPGPRGLPIVGNLFDLADSESVREKVRNWHQTYGDVFYTKVGATDYVWLSSPKAVKDLMDKKSAIYSSRPHLPLAQDVASGGSRQLFMAYGQDWRNLRKHSHSLLNLNATKKYQSTQELESRILLQDLLNQPDQFYTINRRYSTSVILLATYGYRIPSFQDPLITKIFTVLEHLSVMMAPGAFAVEVLPALARLPERFFGNWRTWGRNAFAHDSKVYLELWQTLKQTTDDGSARDCFCKDFYLGDPKKNGIDDLLAAYTCGGLVEAGAETTATTINNWTLAMILFPDVMRKGQEELDRVVGSGRLPTWDDEKNLPYIRAMIKETLRWRPVNKFGMYHASTEDDWYDGFFIPKGSTVVLNWWAIQRDSSRFEQPDIFEPARFLEHPLTAAEYMNAPDPYDRDHFSYGAGRQETQNSVVVSTLTQKYRRACPGVHLAEKSLFIVIARTLWGFDIKKKLRSDGSVVVPTTRMMPGFLSVPEPFLCDILCRSPAHEGIIRRRYVEAETDLAGMNYGF